jgi:hypothetical protein
MRPVGTGRAGTRCPCLRASPGQAAITVAAALLGVVLACAAFAEAAGGDGLPARLSETGLHAAGSDGPVNDDVVAFVPQYPLWTDGARKRRWIRLPPGGTIDGSDPDAWVFPAGTRLWKEFGYDRPVETRLIERRSDGSWRFATYLWQEDGSDAGLAAEDGAVVDVAAAPGGRYVVPSRSDCRACHEGAAVPVLGFSALQLSPDRDPLAPHADLVAPGMIDLATLAAGGLIVNLPPALLATPPRVQATDPQARAALGYLHANCGHCHNHAGALDGLEMLLAQQVAPGVDSVTATLGSLLGRSSRFRPHGAETAQRIAADGRHTLTLRMRTTNPFARMPPLGVQVVDDVGVSLVERWIADELRQPGGTTP